MREFNAVVLGAGGVGKSALTCRFIKDQFLDAYDPTIEDAYTRDLFIDGEWSRLEVLDTAGAEQFLAFNEMVIKSGMAFILVFSLTQKNTLKEVEHLRRQIYQVKGLSATIPMVVVGTKSDLTAERDVDQDVIQATARRWNLPFYETSAKRNINVSAVFEDLVRQMRIRYPREEKYRKHKGCIIM